MRIGIVLAQKLGYTGSGTYCISLARGLQEIGHDVRLLVAVSGSESYSESDLNVSTVPFGCDPCRFPIPGMSNVMPYESSRFSQLTREQAEAYLDHWRRYIIKFSTPRLDILHVNHWWLMAAVAVSSSNVPVVATLHGTELEQWGSCPHLTVVAGLDRLRPAQFHAVSGTVKAVAVKMGLAGTDGAVVIPPPYRDDIFSQQPSGHRDRSLSLCVGKLSERKGIRELLTAFLKVKSLLPAARLSIIGDAPQGLQKWQSHVAEMGLAKDVCFQGFLSQRELADEYRRADVTVVPSWHEGYSLVAVEAASCGDAVVMPRYGGADVLLESALPSSQLHLFQPLEGDSDAARKAFTRRLASHWFNALSRSRDVNVGNLSPQLARLAGCRAIAERMECEVYKPAIRRH